MSLESSDRISSRQIIGLTIVLALSVVLPLSILYASFHIAFRGKPIRAIDNEVHFYRWGNVKNGELCYLACHIENDVITGQGTYSLRRVNLQTGEPAPPAYNAGADMFAHRWVNDELYAITETSVARLVGESFGAPIPLPKRPASFKSFPFDYEGRLTAIVDGSKGNICLMHLEGDQWIEGPAIRLPVSELSWVDDSTSGRPRLLASVVPAWPASKATRLTVLAVQRFEGVYHLFATARENRKSIWFHRIGFDFECFKADMPSALDPENELQEFAGWERILQLPDGEHVSSICIDQFGLLATVFSHYRPARLLRQQANGEWKPIGNDTVELFSWLAVETDITNGATYLVDSHCELSFAKIYRVVGDSLEPTPLVIQPTMQRFLDRWKCLAAGTLFGWFLHLLIVVVGIELLRDRKDGANFESGIHRVRLAGTMQRGLAFLTDAFVFFLFFSLAVVVICWTMQIEWKDMDTMNLCLYLLSCEEHFIGFVPGGHVDGTPQNKSFIDRCGEQLVYRLDLIALAIGALIILATLKVVIEGRWGTTPGKWLWGIKTMRTTLRPCGFAQSLLRNLLCIVDLACFVTPLPAMLSSFFSPTRQRLGDRFADTIVIKTKSIERV